MPHTTLMHLLWTWLLLESQKGATLYFIVMFLEQQLLGNFTEYRTQKLEPNYSMNTKSYGSDYNIYFTSCTIRYHSQWDRKHSGYPCQCIQVLPAWLSPVFIRLAWGWAFLRWTVKKRNKKKILSRSCGGMWSLSILSHFCCCQSQFSAWWNFIKLLRVLWEELLSTFIHILNKKGRYSKCFCQGLMHWNQTLEFKNAVDCMTWGSWRVTLNCKRQSALTKMHLFLVWVMSVFYLMWMLHPVKPDLRVKLVEHT